MDDKAHLHAGVKLQDVTKDGCDPGFGLVKTSLFLTIVNIFIPLSPGGRLVCCSYKWSKVPSGGWSAYYNHEERRRKVEQRRMPKYGKKPQNMERLTNLRVILAPAAEGSTLHLRGTLLYIATSAC